MKNLEIVEQIDGAVGLFAAREVQECSDGGGLDKGGICLPALERGWHLSSLSFTSRL